MKTPCGHAGCAATTVSEWTIAGYDPEPTFWLCAEHAAAFGFCLSCGAFIGGTEDVFLTGETGLCFECFMDMQREEHSLGYENDDDEY